MTAWREMRLGDFLTLQRGFDLPARDRIDGPYPIVSSSGITGRHAVAKVDPPGVVIGRTGTLGSVYWVTDPYWPHNTALWVKDFKGNDPRFASYLLRTISHDGSAAAAVPGVNRNHLHVLPVRVPELSVQRRIAAVLELFDELITVNERRIKLLEDLAHSLYREWCRTRVAPGRCQRKTLGELCDVVRGRSYKRTELSDGAGMPFLNLKCVARGGGFRYPGLKWYTGRFSDAQRVTAGEVLVAVTDMTQERRIVGQAFRVPPLDAAHAVPSLDLVVVRPREEGLTTFVYAHLRYSGFSDRVRQYANGANVLHLAVERILEAPIDVPSMKAIKEVSNLLDPILNRAEMCEAMNRKLVSLRDLLLPRIVTGRLDLSGLDFGGLLPGESDG